MYILYKYTSVFGQAYIYMCVSTDISTLKKEKKCTKGVRNISDKEITSTYVSHLDSLESIGEIWFLVRFLLCLQSTGWTPVSSYSTTCWQRLHISCH